MYLKKMIYQLAYGKNLLSNLLKKTDLLKKQI